MLTLEDIASAEFVARTHPIRVAALCAVLSKLTPSTLVVETGVENARPITMQQLADEYRASTWPDEPPMTEEAAWLFAVSRLKFGVYSALD